MGKVTVCTREEPFIGSFTAFVTEPENFDPSVESLPLIVFLHGAGESGKSTPETVDKVRAHGIPKYFCADPDYRSLRVITLSPQCPDGFIWEQVTFQLKDMIDSVAEEYKVDMNKISVTGLSMGGYGTWNMLTTYPDFFSKAAPICGGGVSWRAENSLKGKELRVFHSVDDSSVPFACSVDMVAAARRAGAAVEFISYTDEGHGCWSRAYETTDVIEWLCK